MLNNSWKKYGGIRNTDQFHNLNIGTLVADQVLLREKVATTTIFNTLLEARGGLTVTSINATNNIDICNNLIVYNDINITPSKFQYDTVNNLYYYTAILVPALSNISTVYVNMEKTTSMSIQINEIKIFNDLNLSFEIFFVCNFSLNSFSYIL
jgi:hypothetical protein